MGWSCSLHQEVDKSKVLVGRPKMIGLYTTMDI